jgi:hypothetical protein
MQQKMELLYQCQNNEHKWEICLDDQSNNINHDVFYRDGQCVEEASRDRSGRFSLGAVDQIFCDPRDQVLQMTKTRQTLKEVDLMCQTFITHTNFNKRLVLTMTKNLPSIERSEFYN